MQLGAETFEPEPVEQQLRLRRNGFADGEGRVEPIANDQRNAGAGAGQDVSGNGAGRPATHDADVEADPAGAPNHRVQWT